MSVLPQNRNSAQYSVPIMIMGGTEPSDFSHVMRILTKQLKVLGTDGCDATLFSSVKKNIKLFFGCSCMDIFRSPCQISLRVRQKSYNALCVLYLATASRYIYINIYI